MRINYKHYWQNKSDSYHGFEWSEKRIGFWFKTYKAVGAPNWFSKLFSDECHIRNIMIGFDLIVFKVWATISLGKTMTFKIK